MRIAPTKILLDRVLSQAGVLDRGLSHATWASYWSHGAFWTRQRLMTRDFASLHPCRQAAYFLPCARPPDACGSCLDRPRQRRPEGSRDRFFQAFAVTRAGTDTMPTRRDDDEEITADAASEAPARGVRAPRFGPRGASMTPPAPERPATPDDLRTALGPPTSYGVKLFEVAVLLAILKACPDVQDAGDLLILRETLLEDMGPAYMWLINMSLAEWQSLSDADKALNAQLRLDWLASYSKASEAILQHWFWKLLKSKTQNFAPLHHVFVRVKSGSPNCGSEAWTEIFLLYPLTGASIAHKLLARGLQKCLLLTDDSPEACSDDITRINTSVSQLSHLQDMSVRDVFALVILMGLYLSTASGHQKAYKELLAYIDAGNALTLDDVQHAMIRYSRSTKPRAFSTRKPADVSSPRSAPHPVLQLLPSMLL